MIKKQSSACFLAAIIGLSGTMKGVIFTSEPDRKYWSAPVPQAALPLETVPAGDGDPAARMPGTLILKPSPEPKKFPGAKPLPKPQPTPKPTPRPPGAPPAATPTPTPTKPPVTRPT